MDNRFEALKKFNDHKEKSARVVNELIQKKDTTVQDFRDIFYEKYPEGRQLFLDEYAFAYPLFLAGIDYAIKKIEQKR